MATINQIKKQIETANKRLQKNKERVEMYGKRVEKGLAKIAKYTGKEVTADNWTSALDLKGSNQKDWDLYFSMNDAVDYKLENQRKVLNEQNNIINLIDQLHRMEAEQRNNDKCNKPLENALRESMEDFRIVWFNKMINWYGKYYDDMRKALEPAQVRQQRAKTCLYHFEATHLWCEYKMVREFLHRVIKSANEIIYHDANQYSKTEYMERVQKKMEISWENGIAKLVEKCRKFGVNENKIKANWPSVTEKGFEVQLYDGSNRVIDARIIWAAQYSDCVCPHTRYIITERHEK